MNPKIIADGPFVDSAPPRKAAKAAAGALGLSFDELIEGTDYLDPREGLTKPRRRRTCVLDYKCRMGKGTCCELCAGKANCANACKNSRERCGKEIE